MCRLAGVARATYYAWRARQQRPPAPSRPSRAGRPRRGYIWTTTGTKVPEAEVLDWLAEYIADPVGQIYGYRKLTTWLRRTHDLRINKKTVYRLLKEAQLLQGQRFPAAKARHPRVLARNREVTGSNQLWEIDLKYGYIAGHDRFFYLCSVIDVYDRSLLAYHIGWQCTAEEALRALQQAVARRQADWPPASAPAIRSDNGPQFIAHRWAEGCQALAMVHERIPNATPNKNAHIESWHSLLEAECLRDQTFGSFEEAYAVVTTWIHRYNTERMHGSLHDHAPEVFYAAWRRGRATPIAMVRA